MKNVKSFEDFLYEGEMSPVKKVINAILRKEGIKPVKSYTSSVRGFGRSEGKGYKYEGIGFLSLHGLDKDDIKRIATEMRDSGVDLGLVHPTGIEFNHYSLMPYEKIAKNDGIRFMF